MSSTSEAPPSIPALADTAKATLKFDPKEPLRRYVNAIQQCYVQCRQYKDDGNYDLSFVFAVKISILVNDYLPNLHPEWRSFPQYSKSLTKISHQTEIIASELRALISTRNENWEKLQAAERRRNAALSSNQKPKEVRQVIHAPTVAPGSSAALTLKNTVQVGQATMTSTEAPTMIDLVEQVSHKERASQKWKRRLGVGRKEKESGAGVLALPGDSIDADEADVKKEWKMMDANEVKKLDPRMHDGDLGRAKPGEDALRRTWADKQYGGDLPMPGEEEARLKALRQAEAARQQLLLQQQQQQQLLQQQQQASIPYNNIYNQSSTSISNYPAHSWNNGVYQGSEHSHARSTTGTPDLYPGSRGSYSPNINTNQQAYHQLPSQLNSMYLGYNTHHHNSSSTSLPQPLHHPQQGQLPIPARPSSFTLPMPQAPMVPSSSVYAMGASPAFSPAQSMVSRRRSSVPPQIPQPPMSKPNPPTLPVAPTVPTIPTALNQPPVRPSIPQVPVILSETPKRINSPPKLTKPTPPSVGLSKTESTSASNLTRSSSISGVPPSLFKSRWTAATSVKKLVEDSLSTIWGAAPPIPDHKIEEPAQVLYETEGHQPLRPMILPEGIMDAFMNIASPNTRLGIETIGLLVGSLRQGTFHVTTLLIPKQEGTPDNCTATHEEEILEHQQSNNTMTLGWIHTHPTQTCFMSSCDLHNQMPYQWDLPEAVAVVCAPKFKPSWGIFRLTDPLGMEVIKNCRRPGIFHPHEDLPIWTDVEEGHVQITKTAQFICHDLRQ